MKKLLFSLLSVVLVMGALTGGRAKEEAVAAPLPTKELKVALITVLTGPGAAWGIGEPRGLKYAFDAINKAGGIVAGGIRYTVKYWAEDDKFLPDQAVAIANKLIYTDKVNCIMGPLGSASCLAVAPICERNKVLHLSGGFAEEIIKPGANLYTIRFHPTVPKKLSGAMVSKFKELYPNLKTIASIYPDDATGQTANRIAKSFLEKAGYRFVTEVPYARGTKEQRPIVTKALAQKPDALWFMSPVPEDMAVQIKEAYLLGFRGPKWGTGELTPTLAAQVAGVEAAEGVVTFYYDPFTKPSSPTVQELAKRYFADYEPIWSIGQTNFYDAAYCFKQAIEMAGSIDSTALRDQFLKPAIQWPSAFGPAFFVDRDILRPMIISMIKNGKGVNFSLIYPPGYPGKEKQ